MKNENPKIIQVSEGEPWVYHLVPDWGWQKLRKATEREVEDDKVENDKVEK
jgi:hypothetical protein|tara:strand:+ start:3656 stop:3808 length:153 start_codon:yes stop_codon:yes gene_type:complete